MTSSAGRRSRHAVVSGFAELVARPFVGGENALCWPRHLDGDFGEVARLLAPTDGLVTVDEAMLAALPLSAAGRAAADAMVHDLRALDALGREPILNCIARYPRDERGLPLSTDVLSFHVDHAPVEVDTWLCTYHGASSEMLDNDDARRLVDDPAIRARLLSLHGGADDDDFRAFVREGAFDLHYAAVAGAAPVSCGRFNLWRVAVAWPGCPVPPCIHRAPDTTPDEPRLLLIC